MPSSPRSSRSIRSTLVRALGGALLAAGLAGCDTFGQLVSHASTDAAAWVDGFSARRQADRAIVYETTGPVELDIDIFGGDVTVRGRPGADGTEVRIVREAGFGRGREDASAASLDSIQVRTAIEVGEIGQRLVVRAVSLHEEALQQSVDVEIIVPESTIANIRTARGKIDLKNIGGRIACRTGDGSIRLTTDQPVDGGLNLETARGDVDVRTPIGTTGRLVLESGSGTVRHNVESGRMTIGRGTTQNRLDAVVVDESIVHIARTDAGDVRFGIVGDPNAVGRWILD